MESEAAAEKRKQRDREYYAKNSEKKKQRSREYYERNREKCREKIREYYKVNREKLQRYNRDYRAKNREKRLAQHHEWRLGKKYGISVGDYNTMMESQGGVCAICKGTDSGRRLAVDRCHSTGRVHALLCSLCNTGIGQFRDNQEYLRLAIEYLAKHAPG